jgi:hypothetical protein
MGLKNFSGTFPSALNFTSVSWHFSRLAAENARVLVSVSELSANIWFSVS